ncbi:MAG: hypothetical protein J3T61_10220, partial [Candidatus Brocadiales bacterium]|nr:hypothetical protein [Candidatus Bathyanammoxibius sp.]
LPILKDRFTPDIDLYHVEKKLNTILDLLEDFVICLQQFNKRWPGGRPVKELEQENGMKIFDDVLTVESKANLIKQQIIELKKQVDGMMKPRWF